MLMGSARVSKGEEQDTRMQETALRAAGVGRVFTERASGGRLALVTLMQCSENLTDRQAADAVRGRIDWKYPLGLH